MTVCIQRLILNQLDGNPLDVNVTQRFVTAVLMTIHAVGGPWARLWTSADRDTAERGVGVGSLNNELRQAWPSANIRAVLSEPLAAKDYRLTDINRQLTPYVEDVVRSEVPRKTLDEAYESKVAGRNQDSNRFSK